MNNLKRVLSLALSTVMLVGMMAVGASAADFTDAEKIEHDDAVNVLVALNVINGKDDGSFDPQGNVTRAEMAKMIAVAMNGGKDTNTGVKGTATFTDIKGHWAESYIEYCYDMGIISGRGDGTFDPGANVTGLEATKMVLTALGYDSQAYKLTGASWAVRTDELAKQADPKLYEELDDVVMANVASRDTAAQIIWNGLQNWTKRITPQQNTNTGEVTFIYGDGSGTLLKERYDANIAIGSFDGTYEVTGKGEKGEITVTLNEIKDANDRTFVAAGPYNFPSDFDLSYIGEEVKVIYKNGKDSKSSGPDKKDTIYGVFLTGKTQVINTTKADIKENKDDTDKVKIGDNKYDVAVPNATTTVLVVKNFDNDQKTTAGATTAAAAKTIFESLKADQNPDAVKFIFNEDNKIVKAYVTEYKLARVTGVTATKVTLSTDGAITIADNNVYDNIAKDDVVVVTRFYNGSDKDKALFTVTKAETVEGDVKGYKNTENVVVDGTTYKTWKKSNPIAVSDDALTGFGAGSGSAKIGDTVRLYLIGGYVGGIQSLDTAEKNWALITDKMWTTEGLTSSINPCRVTLLFPDGEEKTLTLHKDSKNGDNALVTGDVVVGNLVEYTMSGDKVKTTKVVALDLANNNVAVGATEQVIYDKDKKALTYWDGTALDTKVAAADAVVFVIADKKDSSGSYNGTVETSDNFYAYSLRDLGNISVPKTADAPANVKYKAVAALNDNNQVEVAVVTMAERPSGATSNTIYGIVKSDLGTREVNDEDYNYYVVSANDEDIDVYTSDTLSKGAIVKFDQTSNNCYDSGNVTAITGTYAAVEQYNIDKKLLTYYTWTAADANGVYHGHGGGKPDNVTVEKDAKFIYVDTDKDTSGDEVSITSFDATTGKANIMFTKNSSGLVDLIVVETSGEGFGSTPGFTKTSVVAPSAPDKKLTVDEVKAAGEGVVFPSSDAVKPDTGFGGSYGDFTKLVFFNFTSKAAGDYTMTIKKGSDTVYTEDLDDLAANTKYVLHVDTLANDGQDSGNTCTWSNGGLKVAGTYTFEIVCDADSTPVLKGAFAK